MGFWGYRFRILVQCEQGICSYGGRTAAGVYCVYFGSFVFGVELMAGGFGSSGL